MKTNLTDRYLRNLKPPEVGRLEISDTKRKRLRIRVSPNGGCVWMFEKRVKGGAKRLEEEAAQASLATVQEVMGKYAELHLSQLRTGAESKRQLEAALSTKLDSPITELTSKDLQSAVDEELLAGRRVFANRVRAALLAFANWASVRGYLPQHIGLRIAKPTKEEVRERVLSIGEVQSIYRTAGELGQLWGPLLRLLLLTGQRRGEIVGLKWSEVDLEAARITKAGARTKNK